MKILRNDKTMHLQWSMSTIIKRERRRRKLMRRRVLLVILSGLLAVCVRSAYLWDSQITVEEKATKEALITSQTPNNTSAPVEETIPAQPTEELEPTILRCKLTAYCIENYPHICNNGDSTYTATGTRPVSGRTIAVDPKVIPYGSEVTIRGNTYIAEDCGGAVKGNHIDIVFDTHQEALDFGIQYEDVEVKQYVDCTNESNTKNAH